jgi:tRNA pseudouridine65 synthase
MAIVRGYVDDQTIDYPLKEELDKMTDSMATQNKPAQEAVTDVITLGHLELPYPVSRYQSGRFSLLKLLPKSGRKHQLRRHLSHIRHPIIGDTSHGDGKQNRYAKEHLQLNRLCLIASELHFTHPTTSEMLSFTTDLDDDLQYAFDLFRPVSFKTK